MLNDRNVGRRDLRIDARALKGGTVTACTNLRRSPDSDAKPVLEAVGMPRIIIDSDSLAAPGGGRYAPLAGGVLADGLGWMLLTCGEQVALYIDDTLYPLGAAGATPRCAVASGMEIVLMTDAGAATVAEDADGRWTLTPPASELPGLHLFAGEESMTSATVAGFALATPLPQWGVGIGTRDHLTFTTQMLAAYSRMADGCIAMGSWFQPLLARVKLYDAAGTLLSVGPVTCLSSSSPWAATQGVQAVVSRNTEGMFHYVSETQITASTYKVCLALPAMSSLTERQRAAAARVAYAEVYVTPQSHTADYGALSEFRLEGGDGASGILRMWMPGASAGHAPREAYFTEQFRSLPCVMDALEQKVATVNLPFGRDEAETVVTARPAAGVLAQSAEADRVYIGKALDGLAARAAASSVASADSLTLFALPHRFTATAVCASGNNVVWANLRRLPFAGYDADSMTVADPAADPSQRAVQASVCVTIRRAAGAKLRVVNTGPCRTATATLPPLITYPDPAAQRLEIRMAMADGSVREYRYELTPSSDGTFAYALAEGLVPVTVPVTRSSFTPFVPQDVSEATDSGMALRADASAPVTPLAVARVADAPVMQVLPSWGANANWDYACGRFYLFTHSGVMALAVTAKGALRASLIDPRPSVMPRAAAITPHGVFAAIGYDLVCLSGSKAVNVARIPGVHRIGYDHSSGELWVVADDGVTVISPADGTRYRRTMEGVTAAVTMGSRLLIADAAGVRLAGDEVPQADLSVEWTTRLDDLRGSGGSYLLEMDTDRFDGRVTFMAGDTNISVTRLDGPVHAPLALRLLGPRRTNCSLTLQACITPPFTLSRLRLTSANVPSNG
ncbi:MAG: hypothetical protein NC187_03435 [Candidatus Amulumruptor caecigallinarius]|nr:hypothetical protein [Candidatus Amulumruptor caecigallinarius]MCM1396523.1 hypothetical protein [Candidatus Amulumruptor caecigallinarius]MCM1453419.1 hypothetical protein [bacterium]